MKDRWMQRERERRLREKEHKEELWLEKRVRMDAGKERWLIGKGHKEITHKMHPLKSDLPSLHKKIRVKKVKSN